MNVFTLDLKGDYSLPDGQIFKAGYAFDVGFVSTPMALFDSFDKEYTWTGYNLKNSLAFSYQRTLSLTDQFSLAFGVDADLGFWTYKASLDVDNPSTHDIPKGPEAQVLTVSPSVKLGGSYAFAKKPFRLNLGLELAPYGYDFNADSPDNFGVSKDSLDSIGKNPLYTFAHYKKVYDDDLEYFTHLFNPLGLSMGVGLGFSPNSHFAFDLLLSDNLGYYVSDKMEWVFAENLRDWSSHGFTAAVQITVTY
jgi:hypothetical protein